MQSLYPLVAADFTAKAKQPVSKLEIFIECCAYDLCDFYGKNYLIEAHYSSGERQLSYSPVAAEFTAIIDNTDGLFHPKNTDSPFYSYLKVGRKIIFHTGFKKDGIDYLWQWFEGIISDVQIDTNSHQIIIKGFDYTQYLTEVKLKSPDNYWGSHLDTVTVADQAGYDMPGGCNGVYIAYLDGVQIYAGDYWIYDEGSNKFFFLPSHIPVANDIPLVIYYYTTQVPENVIADLLVAADLYPTQAAALANMDYTATGADDDIARVRFNTGVSVFYAIQKICERVDYEFYFKYDGTPLFKPIATVGASQFTFGKELISSFDYIENIDEVRNHIVIEGEEYSIYDELYRILDGTEIMYTLDDIPDGASYGRMALTSISAGKIIIAGCDAEVTDQMFTNPAARNNVEAWKHASDVTMIDGGKIYTNSIILANISGDLDDIANGASYGKVALTSISAGKIIVAGLDNNVTARMFADGDTKTDIEAWRHASDVTLIDGGDIYADSITLGSIKSDAFSSLANRNLIQNSSFDKDIDGTEEPTFWSKVTSGTWYYEATWEADEAHKKYPWDFVYYARQEAVNNDGNGYILLTGSEFIPIDRTKPYTLSLWIKKYGTVIKWYLGLCFYDSDKAACDPAHDYPASMKAITTTGTSYTHYSGTFGPGMDVEFPADCRYVKIRYYPIYHPTADEMASSMSTGLQFEPGDHVTDWKPYLLPEQWAHGTDATYIDGGNIYTGTIVANKLKLTQSTNDELLDLYQGDDTDQIFKIHSTSVAHGITTGEGLWGTDTDCFAFMRKLYPVFDAELDGGLHINTFTEATAPISFQVYAVYGAASTAKDGTATGAINLSGLRADAANHTYQKCVADENIFCIKTKPQVTDTYQAVFIVDEDGDVLFDGGHAAFQNEDDIQLLGDLENILSDKISKEEMLQKDVFKKHKVVHVNEVDEENEIGVDGKMKVIKTGKKRLDRFISTKRLNMLLMGSIRQLNDKITQLEARK